MIYLDYASATPLSEKAKTAMEPFLSQEFFNPSAPYLPAKRVREAYEEAKSKIAHVIGAKGNDLVITSGATEATNLAFTAASIENNKTSASPRILVLEIEHASVLNAAKNYDYDTIKVQPKSGLIDLDDLKKKLTPETVLISVAMVNNELGTIQPMGEIAEIIKAEELRRLEAGEKLPLYFHSDASQAFGLLNVNIARLKTDLLTLNSAKVYGPKGVGALYVAHGVKLKPLISGGGQERNLRSGTENVPDVIGFAQAIEDAKEHLNGNRKKYEELKQLFKAELEKAAQSTPPLELLFLGDKKHQLASFCPLTFPGLDAERLIYKLEEQGIYVSTGAACAASKGEKSHVLKDIKLPDAEIGGSLRITFGEQTTKADVKAAAKKIAAAALEECARLA